MQTWKSPAVKQELPPGPWMDEPDKAQWIHPASGLDCLIVRGPVGSLCGYVGVPALHPWRLRKGYNDVACSVHGGLTFDGECQPYTDTEDFTVSICHVPEAGRTDDVHWYGFDCAHLGDLSPGMLRYRSHSGTTP